MDPTLTPDLVALRDEARDFADHVVKPGAVERDRTKEFPVAVVREAAKKGWLGLLTPKAYGGTEAGNLRQCLILEEIARADASVHVTISVHNSLASGPISRFGSHELKRAYLPRMATGEILGAYALTEPHSGSDAAALACTATLDGNEWVLNGTKMWITTGDSAGVVIVFARTDRTVSKAKGISAFLVDRGARGFTCGKPEDKLGIRASETVQLFLEDVRVPKMNLLGELNRGFNYAMDTLNGGRVGIATQAIGIAQAALDEVVEHFRGRAETNGARPATQMDEFRIAEMATKIEAARLLCWRAALLRDRGADHVREACMAKLFASQAANETCRAAVELLGAPAFGGEFAAERFFRDARITELYEGTTEVQKLVIARALLKG
jgi:alkylation response protein AidB-like acyl-CoA dehydrogenase